MGLLLSERRPPERVRRLRRAAARHERRARPVRARRSPEHRRWLLRDDTRSRPGDRRGRRGRNSAQRARGRSGNSVQRPGALCDHARHEFCDDRGADERHGLGAFPAAHRERRLQRGARGRARAGARGREPPRREHGRGPTRRAVGDDPVPEPDRDGAGSGAPPDHGRQLSLERARGGPQVPAGQGGRQLPQPEGGRGAVPRAGSHRAPLRGGGRRDGIRRGGPGRDRRTQGRDLRARLPAARRRRRLPARGHHLRHERARRRYRHRGAQRLCEGVHRGFARSEGALSGRKDERRHLESVVLVPRQRRSARSDAFVVPLPRDRGRPRHGHRQCRPTRALRRHPA